MREFLIVLRFELKTMLSKKSFLISTIIVMLGAIVLFSLPRFISNDGQDNNGAVTKEKKMLVYDQMDVLKNQELMQQSFPEYEIQFVDSLSEVKDQVKDGKVDAGFEIRNSSEFVYYVENSSLNDMTSSRFESMMKQNFQTSEF